MSPTDQRHLREAAGWLDLGDWQSANACLEEIEAAQRGTAPVLAQRARVYSQAGHWETAVMLGRLVAPTPCADAEVLLAIGRAACQAGDMLLARQWIEAAIHLNQTAEFKLRCLEDPKLAALWHSAS